MATASQKQQAQKGQLPTKVSTFEWKGVNKNGDKIAGEIQAVSIAEVRSLLRNQGIITKSVRKKSVSLFKRDKPIKAIDIAMITRQISTMLSAGVPLVTTVEMLSKSNEKAKIRQLLGGILNELQAGIPLSDALRPHKKHFDDLYVDLVAAGEHSGSLDTVFNRIATYREKAEALKSKIKKAMFYPIAVCIVAIGVTSGLLLFVVPQFEEIFQGFGAELPVFTQMIIGISRWMQQWWWILLVALVIAIVSFIKSHRNSASFRDKVDALVLKIPAIGDILHKGAMARFARTLATTFAAGVPLIEGLESAAGASGNAVYRDALLKVHKEVMMGMQMNVAMKTTQLFPDMLTQMVLIGEESGSLDNMLNKVANIYEMQVDDAVDGLASLIEPVMMVVIGTLVGGLIIAMYLPIFDMGNVV
ncbi:MAG: type II secretion system F family protein [Parashewanella sp.]